MRQLSFSGPASTVSKPNSSLELGRGGFGLRVVACDDEGAPIGRARRLPVICEVRRVDVVERFDDF
jgi:hypothetical protein